MVVISDVRYNYSMSTSLVDIFMTLKFRVIKNVTLHSKVRFGHKML